MGRISIIASPAHLYMKSGVYRNDFELPGGEEYTWSVQDFVVLSDTQAQCSLIGVCTEETPDA